MPQIVLGDAATVLLAFEGLKASHAVQSIAAYGPSDSPGYVVVLLPLAHGEQLVDLSIPWYHVDLQIGMRVQSGWSPRWLAATGDEAGSTFAILYEQDAKPGYVVLKASWDELAAELDYADGKGYNLLSVDAYHHGAAVGGVVPTYYCAAFEKNPERRNQYSCRLWSSPEPSPTQNARYQAMLRGWARPTAIVPVGGAGAELLTWWQVETFVPWPPMPMTDFTGGVEVHGPYTWEAFNEVRYSLDNGKWPLYVGANGLGFEPRFYAITGPEGQGRPLTRRYHVRRLKPKPKFKLGPGQPPILVPASQTLQAVDAWSEDFDADAFREVGRISRPVEPAESVLALWDVGRLTAAGDAAGAPPPQPRSSAQQQGGAPPAFDASLPGPQESWPALEIPKASPFTLLRDYLKDWAKRRGVRGASCAVAKNDELKIAFGLTYAEDGYPPIEPHHRLRLGSVSKLLSAMAAVRFLGPRGMTEWSLSTPLAKILDIPKSSVNYAHLSLIRPEELVRQRTGWVDDPEDPDWAAGWNEAIAPFVPLEPGELREALASSPVLVKSPGKPTWYTYDYNNRNFAVLGEVISRILSPTQLYSDYAERMILSFWGENTEAHIIDVGWDFARENGEPPCHLRRPAEVPTGEVDPAFGPYQYYTPSPADAAAGQWVLSMPTLCKILSRMSPLSANPLLNEEEVRMLAEPYLLPHGVPGPTGQGRGCYPVYYGDPPSNPLNGIPWDGGAYQPVIALQHNGMVSGGSALAVHIIPFYGPSVAPSVSIAVAVNHDTGTLGFGNSDVEALVGIVRQAELDQSWPEGDLWSD